MSTKENNESPSPARECPFCGEEKVMRHHLGDCPGRDDQ